MSEPMDGKASTLPSSSTFSFTAPFPTSSATLEPSSTALPLKQRRVSLALPNSPRLVPAWSFRDDTGLDSHVAETSRLVPEKRGKMRKIASGSDRDDPDLLPSQEKKQRKKWTAEETQMLVDGCNVHGVGNWKAILNDPNLKFDTRSPVDLKDRFRTYYPDAYKQHYPNAKTHLSSKVRSTLPDGSSIFEKTRSKRRRPFTEEEDRALKAGYEKHGTVWATIVKDPVFQEQNRRSTDLRDRFRNAFPELYQAAGYKPRNTSKKKRNCDMSSLPVRAATDDQLAMSTVAGPIRRRRHTSQGLLRGGTKSVPQSTACSEDEASSGGEEESDQLYRSKPTLKEKTPQPDQPQTSDIFGSIEMETIDPLADPLTVPDFMHSSSQSEVTDSQSQTWSSGLDTPLHSHSWSTAAGSPTSSHISSDYFLNQSPLQRRGDGANMIGKSAWGTQDWFSANPRLDPSSSSHSSYLDGVSASPSSPFSFHNLSHGVVDRYDLFPTSFPHDFTSEVGVGDTHSTFSDEMFPPNGFRGFTHHSNYAGDLIFGARTHHSQQSNYGSSLGFGSGLGLSGMQHSTGIHPMQLHTPGLPGIDEIELAGITLNDQDDASCEVAGAIDAGIQKNDVEATMDLPDHSRFVLQGLDDLVDLSNELHATPPCTPITQPRPLRMSSSSQQFPSSHGRSFSVPPSEARSGTSRPTEAQMTSQLPVRAFPLYHSLSQNHIDPPHFLTHPHPPLPATSALSSSSSEEQRTPNNLYDLPFLDLHYYSGTNAANGGGGGGVGMGAFDSHVSKLESESLRQGQALDLARPQSALKLYGVPGSVASGGQHVPQAFHPLSAGPLHATRAHSLHHRGQSAVSPQDLLFRKGNDNKRKRASWDGGAF